MPISTPTEARYKKERSLLPSQPPMFAGRKKVICSNVWSVPRTTETRTTGENNLHP